MNSQPFPFDFQAEAPRNRSKLILSVDDEPIILYTRKQILELEGYTVLSALDGEDALELFDAYPVIDLVLLDYVMPEMDGLALAREIKSRRPFVPIFMISAHEAALVKMDISCVDSCVSKGTDPQYLLHKIHQLFAPTFIARRSA